MLADTLRLCAPLGGALRRRQLGDALEQVLPHLKCDHVRGLDALLQNRGNVPRPALAQSTCRGQSQQDEKSSTHAETRQFCYPLASISERVPQGELEDPRVGCAEYLAKCRVSQRAVRASEVRVIEKVESFRPEVYTLCLGKMSELDRERFGQRKVEVRDSGLTDNVAPGITECSRGVKSEGRGIEPLLQLCALRPVTRQTRDSRSNRRGQCRCRCKSNPGRTSTEKGIPARKVRTPLDCHPPITSRPKKPSDLAVGSCQT